jgi:hypothetical protein
MTRRNGLKTKFTLLMVYRPSMENKSIGREAEWRRPSVPSDLIRNNCFRIETWTIQVERGPDPLYPPSEEDRFENCRKRNAGICIYAKFMELYSAMEFDPVLGENKCRHSVKLYIIRSTRSMNAGPNFERFDGDKTSVLSVSYQHVTMAIRKTYQTRTTSHPRGLL